MNFIAILIAAVAGMALGFVWYGPLFGKQWMKLMNYTEEDMNKGKSMNMKPYYIKSFLGTLLMAYVLGILVTDFTASMGGALRLGFLGWLALIVPLGINSILWESRPKKLVYLNSIERLITILVMAAVITLI